VERARAPRCSVVYQFYGRPHPVIWFVSQFRTWHLALGCIFRTPCRLYLLRPSYSVNSFNVTGQYRVPVMLFNHAPYSHSAYCLWSYMVCRQPG